MCSIITAVYPCRHNDFHFVHSFVVCLGSSSATPVAVFEPLSGLVAVDLTLCAFPFRKGQSLLTFPLHNREEIAAFPLEIENTLAKLGPGRCWL